ncbi:MAG: hypothetical protein BAJALOKI3v1_50015 [Promethearchaeota archaeon]|nr:MAG: hypothetical protein BAJALOKI3v1_50015 [Candidatus Lokiarchaeota archaeon]
MEKLSMKNLNPKRNFSNKNQRVSVRTENTFISVGFIDWETTDSICVKYCVNAEKNKWKSESFKKSDCEIHKMR